MTQIRINGEKFATDEDREDVEERIASALTSTSTARIKLDDGGTLIVSAHQTVVVADDSEPGVAQVGRYRNRPGR